MISLKCRLDIRLGSQTLHDELVWDVNSTEHDPDSFAAVLCKDLSADSAFVPLVAWHIRQQVDTPLQRRLLHHACTQQYSALSRQSELNTATFDDKQVHCILSSLLHLRCMSTEGQDKVAHPAQYLIQLQQTSHKQQPEEPEGSCQ